MKEYELIHSSEFGIYLKKIDGGTPAGSLSITEMLTIGSNNASNLQLLRCSCVLFSGKRCTPSCGVSFSSRFFEKPNHSLKDYFNIIKSVNKQDIISLTHYFSKLVRLKEMPKVL